MIKKRKKKVWKRDFAVEVDQKVAKRGVSYLTEPEPRKRRERGELKLGEEVADDDSVAENQSQKYFCFLFLPLHSLSLSLLLVLCFGNGTHKFWVFCYGVFASKSKR